MDDMRPKDRDIDAEKARIVRALFDATDGLARGAEAGRTAAHDALDRLKADALALGDSEFTAALETALHRLLSGGTGGGRG